MGLWREWSMTSWEEQNMALSSTMRTFKKINSLKTLFNFSLLLFVLLLFTSYVEQLKYMNNQYVYIFYIILQKAATLRDSVQ